MCSRSRERDNRRMRRVGGRASNIKGGVVSQLPVQARYVGGESGHGRRNPNFTFADVARRKPTDTGCLNKLAFILAACFPYKFGFIDVEAMTRM